MLNMVIQNIVRNPHVIMTEVLHSVQSDSQSSCLWTGTYSNVGGMSVSDELISSPLYIRNPDVVLREEDQDGGLLFNPDTNQIRVLNPTGLLVWQMCDGAHTFSDFADAIRASFDGVPEEQVESDVEKFVQDMEASGFIGTVEQEPGS